MKQSPLTLMALVVAALAVCAARPAAAAPPTTQEINPAVSAFMRPMESDPADDPLRQKLKERHNSAVRLLELRADSYRRGVDDAQKVFEAVRSVADAKMDLARDDAEREAALRDLVGALGFVESRLENQAKSGLVPPASVEQARLARLTAEVQLLKLKHGAAGPATRP